MTTLFTLYYYKEIQLSVLFSFKTLNAVFLFSECCGFFVLKMFNVYEYIPMQ